MFFFFCLSFLSQFAYSEVLLNISVLWSLRDPCFFSSCGLFRDLNGNAVWGAPVPLSWGFFGLAFSSFVGVLASVSLLAPRVSWLLSVSGSVQHFLVSVHVQLHM